jgi:RimJ/RimL family protein N-acetyltransferase
MASYHIAQLPNRRLWSYLRYIGPAGVFSRYVSTHRPDARSWAVLRHNRLCGVAIAGHTAGLNEAYAHWLFADTPDAAALLAQPLLADSPTLYVPLSYLHVIQQFCPQRTISTDRLYLLPPTHFKPVSGNAVVRLSANSLRQLNIPAEMQPLIGSADAWQEPMALFGIVHKSTLVCIGEILVQDRHSGVIQQIYTLPDYRGAGLAPQLVSQLARRLLTCRKLPIYVVAEDNLASRRVVEKLGFILDSCWGYLD